MKKRYRKISKERESRYSQFYERLRNHNYIRCYYCGFSRNGLEYVPPIHVTIECFSIEQLEKNNESLLIIPTCADCNHYLKDKEVLSVEDGFNYVVRAYKELADSVEGRWEQYELEELGPGLKDYIKANYEAVKTFRHKLNMAKRRYDKFLSGEI